MTASKSPSKKTGTAPAKPPRNFIRPIINEDIKTGRVDGKITTRFPPEPNGYLHIGHAKSICLNFGLAAEFDGTCHLRFDDTNPEKETEEYAAAIRKDVAWLGFDWGEHLYFTSDYFERLFAFALKLIDDGKAYVDDQSPEFINKSRGTLTHPGQDSPWRNRSPAENRGIFLRMRAGEFEDGQRVLRAKIDMAAPNIVMRDPVLYRIRKVTHPRTGDEWPIYPMYDFAHCLSDAIEKITHSVCTLEFENNRALYDWVIKNTGVEPQPHQYEFARLNLNYTVLSKRKLVTLVENGHVEGWDDPRLPTLSGLRRRGYTPAAIRHFCEKIGVARRDSVVDMALLEHTLRDDLNHRSRRAMAVLAPVRLVIDNYPADQVEEMDVPNHPEDEKAGKRKVPFSRELYVEHIDFMEAPPKNFFRLAPGREVRLRSAYYVTCTGVDKDADGRIVCIHCDYDPKTRGGWSDDGRKVRGTIHWVSAAHAVDAEIRLYDRLFNEPLPDAGEADFTTYLNPKSLRAIKGCKLEPSLADAAVGAPFQFERIGYFCRDTKAEGLVFNRTVTLRDTWAKMAKK